MPLVVTLVAVRLVPALVVRPFTPLIAPVLPAPPEVAELAERRAAARRDRDFEAADLLRDELAEAGWEMRDEPGGGYILVRRGS